MAIRKNVWVFALVVLTVVSVTSALKCLKCNDCDNEPSKTSNCLHGFNACLKTDVGGKIRKMCAPNLACTFEDVDRTSINPLKNLKNIFSDHDFKKLIHDKKHARDKLVHCCDTDFCNGSPNMKANLGLLFVLPLALYLFRWC